MRKFLYLLSLLLLVSSKYEGKLRFREDGTFTILQLTDLHFGEINVEDLRTLGTMYFLLDKIKPDYVMLSGDLVSGQAARCHYPKLRKGCYERNWKHGTLPLEITKTPYSLIIGNHDLEGDLTGKEIMDLDMTNPHSLSQKSPDYLPDGSNYYIPIYANDEIQTVIWLFDSHSSECDGKRSMWGCVERDQVQWFDNEYKSLKQQLGLETIESISFVHIPPVEYIDVYRNSPINGNKGEVTCCPCTNTGFVDALLRNDVKANFVGHDHSNDFGGEFQKDNKTIGLYYGRKSGYGSYEPSVKNMRRGGNVITLTTKGQGKIEYSSYIMDEGGNVFPRNNQTIRNDSDQTQCSC